MIKKFVPCERADDAIPAFVLDGGFARFWAEHPEWVVGDYLSEMSFIGKTEGTHIPAEMVCDAVVGGDDPTCGDVLARVESDGFAANELAFVAMDGAAPVLWHIDAPWEADRRAQRVRAALERYCRADLSGHSKAVLRASSGDAAAASVLVVVRWRE